MPVHFVLEPSEPASGLAFEVQYRTIQADRRAFVHSGSESLIGVLQGRYTACFARAPRVASTLTLREAGAFRETADVLQGSITRPGRTSLRSRRS